MKTNNINTVISNLVELQNIALKKIVFINKKISENKDDIKKLKNGKKVNHNKTKDPFPTTEKLYENFDKLKFKLIKSLNNKNIEKKVSTDYLPILLRMSIDFEEYEISQIIQNEINKRNEIS